MPQLIEGEERTVTGSSGTRYTIKRVGGDNSCSCPAWRNQHRHPSFRTCGHLLDYVGEVREAARIRPGGAGDMPATVERRILRYLQAPSQTVDQNGNTIRQGDTVASRTPPWMATIEPEKPSGKVDARLIKGRDPAPVKRTAWAALLDKDPYEDEPSSPPPVQTPSVVLREESEDESEVESENEDGLVLVQTPAFQVLLAESWDGVQDPTGMLMSEKLDGVRAYWTGERFLSRNGNEFAVPDYYMGMMPPGVALDGEFWMGRGRFQETSGYVRRKDKGDYWGQIQHRVFDMPDSQEPFTKRLRFLEALVSNMRYQFQVVPHTVCHGIPHLREQLALVEDLGGEGLMLRNAQSLYVRGKSSTLLKVKNFYDAEAMVTGYTAGKGQHRGLVGALTCRTEAFTHPKGVRLEAGVAFRVGTFPVEMRRNPPPVGSRITFRFQGATNAGVPRIPTFVAVRDYEGTSR